MKNPLQRFKKFFLRTRKMNATAARPAIPRDYEDEEEGGTRLSSAFVIVLLLHVVAVVGVIAFARIKANRTLNAPPSVATTTQEPAVAPKNTNVPPARDPQPAPAAALAAATPPTESQRTAPAHTMTAPGSGKTHIVKAGENLTKISFAYGLTAADLAAANDLKDEGQLRIGQVLNIPDARNPKTVATQEMKKPVEIASKPPTASKGTYVVQKGDNPVKIARELGVTYDEFVKLNNIKDPKKLQPGQVLKVPQKKG